MTKSRLKDALKYGDFPPGKYSRYDASFSTEDIELLGRVGSQAAIALDNAFAFRRVAELKDRLAEEKEYLEEEL